MLLFILRAICGLAFKSVSDKV